MAMVQNCTSQYSVCPHVTCTVLYTWEDRRDDSVGCILFLVTYLFLIYSFRCCGRFLFRVDSQLLCSEVDFKLTQLNVPAF